MVVVCDACLSLLALSKTAISVVSCTFGAIAAQRLQITKQQLQLRIDAAHCTSGLQSVQNAH
jgi:hypothetical protein